MTVQRSSPGITARGHRKWELVVESGRDPVSGRRGQVSRMFQGTISEAKKARAALLTDVTKGRNTGTRATVDDLFSE